jgi:thioredoxin-related protein
MKTLSTGLAIILAFWFCVSSAIAQDDWLTSLEEAKKVAKKQDKDILIDFTSSDWSGWCIKLREEVFGTEKWKKAAFEKYVMVIIDFPKQKQLSKEQQEYNTKLGIEFGVKGYPTIFLLDSNGKAYAKTGYQSGGAEKYLVHLEEFADRKTKRDELLKQAKDSPAEKRPQILADLVDQLNKWEVGFDYPEIKDEIVSLDSQNKAGLRLKYAFELTLYYHRKGNKEKTESYLSIVKKINADKGKEVETDMKLYTIASTYMEKNDWKGMIDALKKLIDDNPKGESPPERFSRAGAQKIYYYTGVAYLKLNSRDDRGIENLNKALTFAPDSQLAAKIKQMLVIKK